MTIAEVVPIGPQLANLSDSFGQALAELGHEIQNLVVLDADSADDTGAHHFRSRHPSRFFQFGRAEHGIVAAASGLSAVGMLPVISMFAASCARAVEQARFSIASAKRNLKIVATQPAHDTDLRLRKNQSVADFAAFRAVPGMTVICPADPSETALATRAIFALNGPVYMRAGGGPAKRIFGADHTFEIGRGKIVREGSDVTLVACGTQLAGALDAAEALQRDGISARVVNMPTIKPIDKVLLANCARETGAIVSAEDHNILGGLGGAIAEALVTSQPCPMEFVGWNENLGAEGKSATPEYPDPTGAGVAQIEAAAKRAVARKTRRYPVRRA